MQVLFSPFPETSAIVLVQDSSQTSNHDMNVDRYQPRVLQGTFQTHRIEEASGSGSEVEVGIDEVILKETVGGRT
jgi:hypothetical protein